MKLLKRLDTEIVNIGVFEIPSLTKNWLQELSPEDEIPSQLQQELESHYKQHVSKYNIRKKNIYEGLVSLAFNIKQMDEQVHLTSGLIELPTSVFEDGTFKVLTGAGRFLAYMIAGYKLFPARILEGLTEKEKLLLSISEGIHKRPSERGDITDATYLLTSEHATSIQDIAELLGRTTFTVKRWLSVKELKDVSENMKQEVESKKTSYRGRLVLHEFLKSPFAKTHEKYSKRVIEEVSKGRLPQDRLRRHLKWSRYGTAMPPIDLMLKHAPVIWFEIPLKKEWKNALVKCARDHNVSVAELLAHFTQEKLKELKYLS